MIQLHDYNIHHPGTNYSEFELQSYLYGRLKKAGVDVRGEVSAKNSILDLVLFYKEKAFYIVETKKPGLNSDNRLQISKYRKFGIPIRVVTSFKDADQFVSRFIKNKTRKYKKKRV